MKKKKLWTLPLLCLTMAICTTSIPYSPSVQAKTILESNEETSTIVTDLEQYENDQLIVTYKNDTAASMEYRALSKHTNTIVEELDKNQFLVTATDSNTLEQKLEEYVADPNVDAVQPNYTYHLLSATNEPDYSKQWWTRNDGTFTYNSYADYPIDVSKYPRYAKFNVTATAGYDTNVESAWSLFTGDRSITIALVDTGVDTSHQDLSGVIYTNTAEIAGDHIDNDKNGYIDDVHGWNFYNDSNDVTLFQTSSEENDHGTHCAGVIGARVNGIGIAGIASNINVNILPVKVLGGKDGTGSTADIVAGIKYAETMGAQICNLSLGYDADSTDPSIDKILKTTIENSSMFFVIASGNGDRNYKGINTDTTPVYPASYDCNNIISVANMTCLGILNTSSNYGVKTVDIAAPGTCIYSTISNNSYEYYTGTSMSAPMVSAGLAEIYSYYTNLTVSQCAKVLLGCSKPVSALSGKLSTGGMLDIYGALTCNLTSIISDQVAPTITTQVEDIPNSYKKNLVLTVIDGEDHLQTVRYAKGKQDVRYFASGKKGTALEVSSGKGTIPNIASTKDYTIYAIDTFGNETVVTVPVSVTKPSSIKLSVTKKTLKIGKKFTLKATPDVATTITFSSSNKKVATVTSKGVVTGKKVGTCKITAKTENGVKAICKMTIKK
ncbi:S8 family serine peptidase [Anaerosporobacter faecicola]|uniref:S8 family serine peptidase n=1 Tax=Anaerosporobacter faecicola TaxID=2718714 RepID=UPI00143A67F6|nr:S8 family serine peptidase [Anaerosporobacter faecicola]